MWGVRSNALGLWVCPGTARLSQTEVTEWGSNVQHRDLYLAKLCYIFVRC